MTRGITVRGRLMRDSKCDEIEVRESGEWHHGDGHNDERYEL